jgi:hypothetical protein
MIKEEECKTIMQLADFVCENMVYDEEKKIYHQKVVGDPQWIQDMIHECHYQGMLPDDYVFQWVYEFCREISELDENDDPHDIEVHSDTYTHDLLKWLSSNLARIDFVEDAFDDSGWTEKCDLVLMIGIGQEKEMEEVLWTIIDKLQDRLDELEDFRLDRDIELFHDVCKEEIN